MGNRKAKAGLNGCITALIVSAIVAIIFGNIVMAQWFAIIGLVLINIRLLYAIKEVHKAREEKPCDECS